MYQVPHVINAQRVLIDENTLSKPIYNPARGEAIGTVYFASDKTCQQAVESAQKAWPSWSDTSVSKRTQILFRFRELLEKHQNELIQLVTREHGKTLDDAKGSLFRAIEVIEMFCGLTKQWQGDYSANVATHIDCYTQYQSLGVCAGVSPFNFPIMVPVWMMIPAIACGNTFILKPSEQDPSAPVRLVELLYDAGLPTGVVQCLHGGKDTVDYLLHHPDIAAFTAVASTPVAASIYKTATAQGKRAHTFGGAKNHCLIMPDADLEYAAQAIVGAAYGSAGERCMAISVVVVVGDTTAQGLLKTLQPLVAKIQVDAGDAPHCDMGPLISAEHRQRVVSAIEQGVMEGAELLLDGRTFQHPQWPNGFYLGPTLFDKVTPQMSLYQNEIFGPVLIVLRVNSFEEGLLVINQNRYGNGTAIFTQNGYFAREFSQGVQVGMVGINIPIPVPVATHPFGGWKQSAFGDTNMHGLESIHFYTKRKTVTCKWPQVSADSASFAMPTHR